MTLKEFFVSVSLDYDKKDYDKLSKSVKQVGSDLKRMGLAVGAVAGGLFALTKSASSHSRTLSQQSQELGINVERLQELQHAAKVASNVSGGELQSSLHGLSQTLVNVRKGNFQAGNAFNQLGINMGSLIDNNLRADQAMLLVADRLKQVQDPMRKAALAQEIFGGAGAKLIPLLDQGSKGIAKLGGEARTYGNFLSKGAIKQGVAFDKSLTRMTQTMKGILNIVGIEFIKVFRPLLLKFQQFIGQNRKLIATKIKEYVEQLVEFMYDMIDVLKVIFRKVDDVIQIFGGWTKVLGVILKVLPFIFGAQLISSIGNVIGALRPIGSILAAIGLKFNLIALAVAAVILVWEDFYTFLEGGNSVIGKVVDKIDGFVDVLNEKFPTATKIAAVALQALFAPIRAIVSLFRSIGTLFSSLKAGKGILNSLGDGASKFGDSFGAGFSNLKGFFQGDKKFSLADQLGLQGGGKNKVGDNNTSNSNINNVINVAIPPGTTPGQAVNIVAKGVEQGVNSATLRQTRNNFTGGVGR